MPTQPLFRTTAPMLLLAIGASAFGQLTPTSYSGTILNPDNSAYSGTPLNHGDRIKMKVGDGNGASAQSVFKPQNLPDSHWERKMIKFQAEGDGNFMLPSDRAGNMSSANSGDRRIMGTWNAAMWWQGNEADNHRFASSVTANSNDDAAAIDIDVRDAPIPSVTSTSGSFMFDALDGSSFDQNPTPGQVELNRGLTPIITINFTIPTYTWTRDVVTWNDNTTTPSINTDAVTSNMWMIFFKDQAWSNTYSIFDTTFASEAVFNQHEGLATRTINGYSGQMTMDISQLALGMYETVTSDIAWNRDAHDDVLEPGYSGQFRNMSTQTNINVVPEPGTMIALGAGAALLAARRRKKA